MGTGRTVSIVIPTCNRLWGLRRAVEAIRESVHAPTEIIVVDGASTDGTREWLADRQDLSVILETRREGAVRGFNKGFHAATGHYVMWLNDDAYPLPGAVEAAVEMIERSDLPDLGMVAFYHSWDAERNILDSVHYDGRRFSIYNVRGYPYANFGLLRRELLKRLGFADERYYFFGFDPDLSLKVQLDAGLEVIGCRRALVHHDEHHDDRKIADLHPGRDDNEKLFSKWNLPPAGSYPDPGPAYRDMLRRRGLYYPAPAEVTAIG